jgi:hypothetical protein
MGCQVDFRSKTHEQDHTVNGNRAVTVCRPQEGLFRGSEVYLPFPALKPFLPPLKPLTAHGPPQGVVVAALTRHKM